MDKHADIGHIRSLLQEIHDRAVALEGEYAEETAAVRPEHAEGARNLVHYLALRESGTEYELQIVGKKAAGYFTFAGTPIAEQYTFGDRPEFEAVAEVASSFISRRTANVR